MLVAMRSEHVRRGWEILGSCEAVKIGLSVNIVITSPDGKSIIESIPFVKIGEDVLVEVSSHDQAMLLPRFKSLWE